MSEDKEPFSESKLHETFDGPEITEGEKTENSAHGQHCGGLNCPAFEYACADVCMRPIIKEPVSEPSESQEDRINVLKLVQLFQMHSDDLNVAADEVLKEFHITRRK